MDASLKQRVEALTSGELDVLRLAAAHLRSSEIGHRLGISPKTVDNRISRAMKRLSVSDRDSAVRLLIDASQMPWGKSLGVFSSLPDAATGAPGHWVSRLPWPWPTRWRPENDHPFAVKLTLVVLLAAFMMLSVAGYIAAVVLIDRLASGRP